MMGTRKIPLLVITITALLASCQKSSTVPTTQATTEPEVMTMTEQASKKPVIVESMEPNTGPIMGGQTVHMRGKNFKRIQGIYFGSPEDFNLVPNLHIKSNTQLSFTVPVGYDGDKTVRIAFEGGMIDHLKYYYHKREIPQRLKDWSWSSPQDFFENTEKYQDDLFFAIFQLRTVALDYDSERWRPLITGEHGGYLEGKDIINFLHEEFQSDAKGSRLQNIYRIISNNLDNADYAIELIGNMAAFYREIDRDVMYRSVALSSAIDDLIRVKRGEKSEAEFNERYNR